MPLSHNCDNVDTWLEVIFSTSVTYLYLGRYSFCRFFQLTAAYSLDHTGLFCAQWVGSRQVDADTHIAGKPCGDTVQYTFGSRQWRSANTHCWILTLSSGGFWETVWCHWHCEMISGVSLCYISIIRSKYSQVSTDVITFCKNLYFGNLLKPFSNWGHFLWGFPMENIHNGGGGSVPSLVNMFSAPGRKSFKPFHITVVSRCIAVQLSRPQYIAGFYFFF